MTSKVLTVAAVAAVVFVLVVAFLAAEALILMLIFNGLGVADWLGMGDLSFWPAFGIAALFSLVVSAVSRPVQ